MSRAVYCSAASLLEVGVHIIASCNKTKRLVTNNESCVTDVCVFQIHSLVLQCPAGKVCSASGLIALDPSLSYFLSGCRTRTSVLVSWTNRMLRRPAAVTHGSRAANQWPGEGCNCDSVWTTLHPLNAAGHWPKDSYRAKSTRLELGGIDEMDGKGEASWEYWGAIAMHTLYSAGVWVPSSSARVLQHLAAFFGCLLHTKQCTTPLPSPEYRQPIAMPTRVISE